MDDATDIELAQRAAKGERAAFAALLERHYLLIYRLCYKWCGHRADAEDITQEVCVKLARAINSFRGEAAFTSWLYRLSLNVLRDYYRARKHIQHEAGFVEGFDAPSPSPTPEEEACDTEIYRAVHALSPKLKEAVLLVCSEGLNHAEAAKALGCSENTISWRVFEAKKQLRALWEKNHG